MGSDSMGSDSVGSDGAARRNPFTDRLRGGELTLMLGIRSSRTADVVRIARETGYHAIMVDLEHSTMPLDVAARLCATAGDLGMMPFVRVPEREYGAIGRLLDCGAQGIVAPRIETVEEARTVAGACRFAPRGQRSQLAMVPQLGMRPTPARTLNPALDDATVVQMLIETPAGIASADAIAALDGVDMLGIGANDLTAELGVPGAYGDPRVRDAVATAAAACQRHGKLLMVGGIADLDIMDDLMPLGVCPLMLAGTDTDLLFGAAAERAGKYARWRRREPVGGAGS
jgi:2-keto-3-deoxy-L-rhamnonate aldolase RhmA